MSANISGHTVLTLEEYSELTERLELLERQLDAVSREAEGRAEENASQIRIIASDLNVERARIDRLKANVQNLETILNDIAAEATRGGDLIGQVVTEIARSAQMLDGIAASTKDQIAGEVARRHEMTEALERLLNQHKAEASLLQESFADIAQRLTRLAQAEEDSTVQMESAVELLRDTVSQVQSDTHQELTQTIQAVVKFAQDKTARHNDEKETMARLVSVQKDMRTQLEGLQRLAEGLATSSEEARRYQERRLAQARSGRINDLNRQGVQLAQLGEYDRAHVLFEEAAALAPEDPAILTNRALASWMLRDHPFAEESLIAILAAYPQQVEALNALGVFYLDTLQPASALSYLEPAAQLAPDSAIIWLNLGKAYFACDKIRPALEAWRRASELDPGLLVNEPVVRILVEEQAISEGAR